MPSKPQSLCILGDSLALLRRLPPGLFDACIADPPYNMSKPKGLAWAFSSHVTMQESWDIFTPQEYLEFTRTWLTEVARVVKENGNLFFFGTYHNIHTLGHLLQEMRLKILNNIIWVKPNAQPNITCRMLTESSEQVLWVCNNDIKRAKGWYFNYALSKELNGGKQMRSVWEIPLTPRSERRAGHPNQKPERLVRRIIQIATRPGDWVLDPFAGVGTTGAAALAEDRRFFLIERSDKYFQAQKERFEAASRQVTFLEAENWDRWSRTKLWNQGRKAPQRVDATGTG